MIFLMVFMIIGILGIPYMWLIFTDDHHAIAYGTTIANETGPEPQPVAARPPALEETGRASEETVSETAARHRDRAGHDPEGRAPSRNKLSLV